MHTHAQTHILTHSCTHRHTHTHSPRHHIHTPVPSLTVKTGCDCPRGGADTLPSPPPAHAASGSTASVPQRLTLAGGADIRGHPHPMWGSTPSVGVATLGSPPPPRLSTPHGAAPPIFPTLPWTAKMTRSPVLPQSPLYPKSPTTARKATLWHPARIKTSPVQSSQYFKKHLQEEVNPRKQRRCLAPGMCKK